MQRLLILLGSGQPNNLEALLRDRELWLSEIAGSLGGSLRLAVQLEGDPLATPPPGGARCIRPLRGLVEVTIPGDEPTELLAIVAALTRQLDGVADWSKTTVSIGRVHEVLPAASDVVLVTLAANRLPSIDRAAFHAYWLDEHAALTTSMLDETRKLAMGYQQVHTDQAASERATELTGACPSSFDGVLQCSLARINDLPHLSVPGFAEAIMKDEENFADQSAQMLGAFMRTLQPEGAGL
tara:strand:+ start:19153 stop:19872 length:720 start_codon:yes stop_codon:yes gene_type:complete